MRLNDTTQPTKREQGKRARRTMLRGTCHAFAAFAEATSPHVRVKCRRRRVSLCLKDQDVACRKETRARSMLCARHRRRSIKRNDVEWNQHQSCRG